jgi:hypothetical protein
MNNRSFFSSGSYREMQHVYLLLKKLGIDSYIAKTTRGYQIGTRNNDSFARFRELISSEHPQKKAKMDAVKLRYDPRHVVRSDAVPLYCGRLLKELLDKNKGSFHITKLPVDYKTIKAWIEGKRRASKEKLGLLLEGLRAVVDINDPLYRELLAWSCSDVQFEKVKKVEKVPSPSDKVYNFSVDGTHNYFVNGLCHLNCQSFAPNHVCIISPERLGLCGAYNWLDCKASHEINPTGPNQPVKKGTCLDPVKGEWEEINKFVYDKSNRTVERMCLYSIIDYPCTACGCMECIAILIPEANGIMVVSREDTSMTPSGMTFSTLAGTVGGGLQTPGVMGVGKYFLTSKKFLAADGGLKRVVWMSSILKETMAEELKAAAEYAGDPDLIEKIADERVATTVEELLPFLEEKGHPALTMPPLF